MPTDPEPVPVDVKELAKEKLEVNYLLENVFLITVDMGKIVNKEINVFKIFVREVYSLICGRKFVLQ